MDKNQMTKVKNKKRTMDFIGWGDIGIVLFIRGKIQSCHLEFSQSNEGIVFS